MGKYDKIKELVRGKLVDRTIDTPYDELSEEIFGRKYSATECRKMLYGVKALLDVIDEEYQDKLPEEDAEALDEKIAELKRERQKFFDQRREYNKLVSKDARNEHLEDRLVEAANNLTNTIGKIDFSVSKDKEKATAVLVFADWHYGMVSDNIWSTYDTDICKERVRKIAEEAAMRLSLHKCETLVVVVLGDLIHGAIHTSSRVASEELVCDQLMRASEILAQAIEYLSSFVNHTYVYCSYGNHARTVQSKDDNLHDDNMERIIPWWLEQRLKDNSSIQMSSSLAEDIVYFNLYGYNFIADHGDRDQPKTAPRMLSALLAKKYNFTPDYILLAHKHHRESFEELGVTSMICGALCGADEYANNKRLFSTPEQTMLIVRPDIGVDAEYHLKCNDQWN